MCDALRHPAFARVVAVVGEGWVGESGFFGEGGGGVEFVDARLGEHGGDVEGRGNAAEEVLLAGIAGGHFGRLGVVVVGV